MEMLKEEKKSDVLPEIPIFFSLVRVTYAPENTVSLFCNYLSFSVFRRLIRVLVGCARTIKVDQ